MTGFTRDLIRRALAWLCLHTDAHVRGWCPCPHCDTAEQRVRPAYGMSPRHPEFVTRNLDPTAEALLSAILIELWPAYEYAAIIDEFRQGRS